MNASLAKTHTLPTLSFLRMGTPSRPHGEQLGTLPSCSKPQLEHLGPSPFPERRQLLGPQCTLFYTGGSLAIHSRGFWETERVWRVQETQGSPLSEGNLHCVLLGGLRAKQWAAAHQVILPAGLRLPENHEVCPVSKAKQDTLCES